MSEARYPRMHVSLYVTDIEKTKEFYQGFFGVPCAKQKPDYVKFILNSPPLVISFIQNPSRVSSDCGHLGFQVETKEEVERILQSVTSAGLVVKEEMGTTCCYAEQDKFWVADPDGFQWEVYYFHKDSEFHDPKYATEEDGVCCTPPPAAKPKVKLKDLSCEPGSGCC